MSAGAPWSVKGIDPKAREVAKDLARRSGMTLGEWLNRVILEDDLPEDVTAEAQFAERLHRMSQTPKLPPKLSLVAPAPDLARIASALDRVTDRIEASETRTELAIHGVEHSVRQALARIAAGERDPRLATTALAAAPSAPDDFSERLRHLEAGGVGPRSAEALRALDAGRAPSAIAINAVLDRLGERLAAAETRTAAALGDLKGALGALDSRLGSVEGRAPERGFEALGRTLSERVEAVRAEVIQKLEAAAGPALEARLAGMTQAVQVAERRATQAVEEIGRQVLAMAEAVSQKLGDVDQRSADAIDQVGTEVARIAGAVELRLARGEHAQAEAFERLGAELSRVTAALQDRSPAAEPQAVADDPVCVAPVEVGSLVETPAEALEQSWASTDHRVDADMARFSEAAASQPGLSPELIPEPVSEPEAAYAGTEEAQEPEPEPWTAEPLMPDAQTAALLEEARQRLGPPPEPEPEPRSELADTAYGEALFSRAEVETDVSPSSTAETIDAPWRRLDLDGAASESAADFAPLEDAVDEDLFSPSATTSQEPALSTREVIDRARAAARAAEAEKPSDMRAKVGARGATGRLFQGFGARLEPRRRSSTLQTALMVAGGAAFLSVGAAGLTLMQGPQTDPAPLSDNPRAAVALSTGAAASSSASSRIAAPVYAQVRADVEAGAPGAVTRLRALADAGHPQAQLYLAQLYDLGEAGLTRDPVEARRLVVLAAENDDVQAMHNLGVFFFRGEGGPQDLASAAQWFRKAAGAGVVESQYNLGLLYQSGSGVRRDLAQARHWFGLAAAKGDTEARRALADMTNAGDAQTVAPAAASQNVRQTQLILARLGYYEGAADGYANPDYRAALAEYQRDQTDPRAGPRPTTVQR